MININYFYQMIGIGRLKIIFVLFLMIGFFRSNAQDPIFSQYYASSLYLNPAMAGLEADPSVTMAHRNQWNKLSPYITTQLSVIYPLIKSDDSKKHWGGLGLTLLNTNAGTGVVVNNGVNMSFAYNLPISNFKKQHITFGMNLGVTQKTFDSDQLSWGTQYDQTNFKYDQNLPSYESGFKYQTWLPEIGAGVFYYHNAGRDIYTKGLSWYMGTSATHLNRPNESLIGLKDSKIPILAKVHGGLELLVAPKWNLSPNLLFVMQQNAYQLNTGATMTYQIANDDINFKPNKIIIGAWYRFGDSFIVSTGLGNKVFNFGFSYDLNKSYLRRAQNGLGAFELTLKLTKRIKTNNPPRFHTPLL